MSGIVAIVGRPNVGKSTLFNRLIERKEAIVDEVSGVTRDRHYGKSDWNGVEFSVIDTGGYLPSSDDVFQKEIDKQVILAIEEADVILFLVDVKDGLTGVDQSIADMLHKSSKETLLLVNKVDNSKLIEDSNEFYSLGFENLFCLSSINGSGTGEFLDLLSDKLPKEDLIISDVPKFAVVGRPIPRSKQRTIVNKISIITLSLAIVSITIIKLVLSPVEPTAPTIMPAVAIAIPTPTILIAPF